MGLSSLGGLSGLGTGGKLSLTGEGQSVDAVHLSVDRRITHAWDVNRSEVTYQGPWEDMVSRLNGLGIGQSGNDIADLPTGDSDTSENYGSARIAGAVLTRMGGGVGRLTVQISQNVHAPLFGLDFVEVSKPIRTWRADKGADAPDLDKIRQWEAQKDASPSTYYALKIGDDALSGNTLKLASFISKGIETYSRYAPLFTIQMVIQDVSNAWNSDFRVGVVGDPACPCGWRDSAGRSAEEFLTGVLDQETGLAYEWLLVKSQLTPRADGYHVWNLAWQGADSIESDLYGGGST